MFTVVQQCCIAYKIPAIYVEIIISLIVSFGDLQAYCWHKFQFPTKISNSEEHHLKPNHNKTNRQPTGRATT